ncbi:MAG TPA: DUF1257 domain-containing protein [Planctomycetaceae bacterium]|nr:DUF1257 domain-containing protein [Planctomycetaceae bacterium]HIQ20913.1 DUF1257 domain-containing protein [Planctomycetota bacterium]
MSTVVVLAPVIVANWPAIAAAVTAAVSTMGYAVAKQGEEAVRAGTDVTNKAEIEVEESEILPDASGTGQEIVVQREGVRARFTRDARGVLRVCVEGAGYSKAELRRMGQELIGRVTQQYVYHRVVTELKQRDMTIVDEEVTEDRTIRIRVRNW